MRVVYFANSDWYLFNFRRDLIAEISKSNEVLLLSPPGPYVERLKAMGVEWQEVPLRRRSLNVFVELGVLFSLWRRIRNFRPDLVHCFTIKCAVYGSLASRVAGNIPRVNAIAGLGYVFVSEDFLAKAIRPFVRALLRFAISGSKSVVIVQNRDDEAMLLSARIADSENIRLIPGSGVDCRRFLGIPREDGNATPVVLMASRLLRDKGVREFLEAARAARMAGRKAKFLLAGDPDSGNPASLSASDLEPWLKDGVVEWLGHVDDMPSLLQSADVAVLPSYREGLSRFLIEAAAIGLPIVTTDVPGCRDVVSHGVDGLLVPPRDSDALAAAIISLLDDPEGARKLGNLARKKAENVFNVDVINAATKKVYAEFI